MPEGDTVFRTARRLDAALSGSVLVTADIRHPRHATVELAGRGVLGAVSVGKHLFVRFEGGVSLHSHLRMDGSWRIIAPGARWPAPGHQVRVVLGTASAVALGVLVHDLALPRTELESELVGHLGPDLLGPGWDEEQAAEAARRLAGRAEQELGSALLDQTVMAGIGNVYRSELCFLLGVSPWTPVSAIDPARAVTLARTLLLRNALAPIRSTTGERRRGRELWVYGRHRGSCLRCGTPVRSGTQGQEAPARTAWYCPTCQPGPHP